MNNRRLWKDRWSFEGRTLGRYFVVNERRSGSYDDVPPASNFTRIRGSDIHPNWIYIPTKQFLSWFSEINPSGMHYGIGTSENCTSLSDIEKPLAFHFVQLSLHEINLTSGGLSLLFGGLGGFLNRPIDFNHFMNLHENGNQCESQQKNCNDFQKLLSAVFTLLFFSIGAALITYSVNKNRDIGGWAVFYLLPGFLFLWFAVNIVAMAR